jgi:hypothetical protein
MTFEKKKENKSKFRGNQFVLFLLNAACLAEKHQIPIFG